MTCTRPSAQLATKPPVPNRAKHSQYFYVSEHQAEHYDDSSIQADEPTTLVDASWSIQTRPASFLRPGMLCFVPSRQEFTPVLEVTRLSGENPVLFIDIAGGRTLQFALTDEVFVRIPPHLA